MAHLPLIDYFACPGELVPRVESELEQAVEEFNRDNRPVRLSWQSVVADESRHLYVPFVDESEVPSRRLGSGFAGVSDKTIRQFRERVVGIVGDVTGAGAGWRREALAGPVRFDLMRFAELPSRVFESAVTFAQEVVSSLIVDQSAEIWQLVLIRFESDAAGDDWSAGGWAADLRWQIVSSYPFTGRR